MSSFFKKEAKNSRQRAMPSTMHADGRSVGPCTMHAFPTSKSGTQWSFLTDTPHDEMTSMFSKIKTIGEHDFSAALNDSFFKVDDLARYGLSGAVTCLAFDPVQSLLAVGTDCGKIHVLGQQNVEVVFGPDGRTTINHMKIVKSIYLVSVDARHRVTVINLDTKEIVSEYNSTSRVVAVETDPSLDWFFMGLENGQIMVYDVDRGNITPYRVGNLQKSILSKARMSPVLNMALHPRDPSQILVCYNDVAVVFSLVKEEIVLSLRYELPAHAPGGDVDPSVISQFRHPPLIQAVWHPNGHHILTAHADGSLVFWDGKEGNILQARTLMNTDVNVPSRRPVDDQEVKSPISKIAWVCTTNPEETSILVSGGNTMQGVATGLTMLDFGPTPEYSITSYTAMGQHYANPRRHKIFPIPENATIDQFWVVARDNPFYAGNYNPRYIMVLLRSGEMLTVSYPDGNTVSDPTLLPPSLGWITPHITTLAMSLVPRTQWIGMMGSVRKSDGMFKGGAPARRHLRAFADRTALCTGHKDGDVKLWDASHGEIEDANAILVSMSNALRQHQGIAVDKISFAGPVAELSVAVENGQVVLFNFAQNKSRGISSGMAGMSLDNPQVIEDIRSRAPPNLKEGFMPQTLVTANAGRVTALTNSNVGFVGIGYENGEILVVDKRGPALIFRASLQQLQASTKKRGSRSSTASARECATVIEFSISVLDDDSYSSIVLTVGTSSGNIYTLRVVPSQTGGYAVEMVGLMDAFDDAVISVMPIDAHKGTSSIAQAETMQQLARGIDIPGILVAVSKTEARVIRQPSSKVTHRKLNFNCLSAGVSYLREGDSLALVCITDQSEFRVLSVPGLREVSARRLPYSMNPQYAKDSLVTRTGDVICRPGLTSGGLIRIWGRGINLDEIPEDALYDVMKQTPQRPTISTIQWVRGRQFTSIEDLDAIIGGPRRPKSKKQIEEERARAEQDRLVRRANTASSSNSAYDMREGVEERGNKIGGVQNALDSLEQSSAEYMNSLNGFIKDAKTSALKSGLKSKFFG